MAAIYFGGRIRPRPPVGKMRAASEMSGEHALNEREKERGNKKEDRGRDIGKEREERKWENKSKKERDERERE